MLDLYTAVFGLLILLPLLGKYFFPYFWLDLKNIIACIHMGYQCHSYMQRTAPFTVLEIFLARVKKYSDKPLIIFEDEVYSYRDIDRHSNQIARVLKDYVGLKEEETMAIFFKNIPAYLSVLIGLSKIGCPMACVNYNLRLKSLIHVLKSCKAKILLTTPDLKDAIEDVLPTLNDEGIRVFYLSDDSPTEGVEALLKRIKLSSAESVPFSLRAHVTPKSTCLYIFTSGTTGLPKAAVISQKKALMGSYLFYLTGVHNKDVIYTPLPLYHSAGLFGLLGTIKVGATCVLRSKFSVSHYWDDCRRYRVTVIQYVGELMRYLCNAPKRDNDRDHRVRAAIGNGLRTEIWNEFLNRFGPIKIYEVYGATEGTGGFINYVGKVGAVGKTNFFIKKLFNYKLVQYDVDADQPVRDEKGFCIPVPTGQGGLMVIQISKALPFEGYAGDYRNTENKILPNVLKKGDSYFNTGDLLMEDHEGFIYFQDRVGDSFRWKGENVATTEVEMTLASLDIIEEVSVYGVPVPGHEGKIGMAAMRLKDGCPFDGKKLFIHTKDYLPSYAIPRFIRIQEKLEITGTFKQRKGQLVKDGFNPANINDPFFLLDDSEKNYIPMTEEIYCSILEKKRKL
ncbi:very long-chain acyl-CoA synthetase-like isoform X1 [Protobothrops mucrosquamatus]|uniref:very long-chain acyl-CoA synthetase-like isoform X1 n=1 Tax=Protobothrops mucrosquamatus TaxID=103944 RepID=UPI000775708D|nr:very long-chain acyl-CoA synthetase-like isoform X1 [Protobothrops mucrosquamatus]